MKKFIYILKCILSWILYGLALLFSQCFMLFCFLGILSGLLLGPIIILGLYFVVIYELPEIYAAYITFGFLAWGMFSVVFTPEAIDLHDYLKNL